MIKWTEGQNIKEGDFYLNFIRNFLYLSDIAKFCENANRALWPPFKPLSNGRVQASPDLRNPAVNIQPLVANLMGDIPKQILAASAPESKYLEHYPSKSIWERSQRAKELTGGNDDTDDDTPLSTLKKTKVDSGVNICAPMPITHWQTHVQHDGVHIKEELRED